MRKEYVNLVVQGFKESGTDLIVFLPDGRLRDLYPVLVKESGIKCIEVTSEAEGVSIAAGAWLGGKTPIMIMTNAGLRVAVEPLARYGFTHEIPVVMLMSNTGELGTRQWWGIAHSYTTMPLLQTLRIPHVVVKDKKDIVDTLKRAQLHARVSLYHTAILLSSSVMD